MKPVYSPDQHASRRPVIAVIGGGASGTLTAVHLLRLAGAGRPPVRIALIDAGGRHGLGQAYSTTHPGHLLNSPADAMSAVAGDAGQLLRWATANRVAHDGFLRRSDYGRYLRDTLAEAARRAGRPAPSPRSPRRSYGSATAPPGTRCGCTSRPTATSTPTSRCWPSAAPHRRAVPGARQPPLHRRPLGARGAGTGPRRQAGHRAGHRPDRDGRGDRGDGRAPAHRGPCGVPARAASPGHTAGAQTRAGRPGCPRWPARVARYGSAS